MSLENASVLYGRIAGNESAARNTPHLKSCMRRLYYRREGYRLDQKESDWVRGAVLRWVREVRGRGG